MTSKNEKVIGIDLGTTHTCIGHFINDNRGVEIIENIFTGWRTTPSVVTFNGNNFKIGKPSCTSDNSVYEVKRMIGLDFNNDNVQNGIEKWSFKVINDDSSPKPKIQVQYKNKTESFYPEEISTMILAEMKKIASLRLDQDIKKAVITVPAYFNDSQREATKTAGEKAGFEVLKIINEPTAAALAYGYDKKLNEKCTILIFDLGGGTFDVSIMEINKGEFKVLAIGGDTHLGGTDFDNRLVDHFKDLFKKKYEGDISYDKRALQLLRTKCEEVKRELSQVNETTIEIAALHSGKNFIEEITRATFEQINKDLFEKTIQITKKTLEECKLDKSQIDEIVLVGGSTRIPKIQNLLKEIFGEKQIKQTINPDEAVAYGAAIQAQLLVGPAPISIRKITDIIPKSVGIVNPDDSMTFFFRKFTQIPNKAVRKRTTVYDNQTSANFFIYEGEETLAKNNSLLGQFVLENIKIAKAGVPNFDCIFEIDENGILKVSAKDLDTLSTNQITITKIRDSLLVKNA